jgi:predicted nucleotidyltransferase component of viral defense system
MTKKELIEYVSNQTKIANSELIEKDIILHLLLINLEKEKEFQSNYVFKGGTCLTKCYLGYYRFSEDLDFTYIPQKEFDGLSEKQIRKELSKKINYLAELLLKISKKWNLEFSKNKKNSLYFDFGANNKFVTFKVWYFSKITKLKQFIKIQINFVELFKYDFKFLTAKNLLIDSNKKEFLFLFPEFKDLYYYPKIKVYDIQEILVEKNRAILTRKAIKARDFVDVFLILNYLNKDLKLYEQNIIFKSKFMLNKYNKYLDNLNIRKKLGFNFVFGDESKLLITKIDLLEFKKFTEKQVDFLNEIITKL